MVIKEWGFMIFIDEVYIDNILILMFVFILIVCVMCFLVIYRIIIVFNFFF